MRKRVPDFHDDSHAAFSAFMDGGETTFREFPQHPLLHLIGERSVFPVLRFVNFPKRIIQHMTEQFARDVRIDVGTAFGRIMRPADFPNIA